MQIYKNNIVKCKLCKDIIKVEFLHKDDHSHRYLHPCKCGAIQIDPDPYICRLLYPAEPMCDYLEVQSEIADEEFLSRPVI